MTIKNNVDYTTLPASLLPIFKEHIRVTSTLEDSSIEMYLAGAIDGIATFGDVDIFPTEYTYQYVEGEIPNTDPSDQYMYLGKGNVFDVAVLDSEDTDMIADYTVDKANGYIYPHPPESYTVNFSTGYASETDIHPNLLTIILRYGSHLYENREAINVGEPKFLPDWVSYAMASVWKPRT